MIARITRLFPLWAVLLSFIAFRFPALFTNLKPAIIYLLALVMYGMGISLTPSNFKDVLKRPTVIAIGVALQYTLMPLFAWFVAKLFGLPAMMLAGMILVGASPGGTASNVICYLSRGDVALSITLTSASTLVAIFATPLSTLLYARQAVEVPVLAMLVDVAKIIILPVTAGVLINATLREKVTRIKRIFPLLSVTAIVLIIAIIVALNRNNLRDFAVVLLGAVAMHNALGLAAGYWIARLMRMDERVCRTMAIEVGMQNSGLAVALAIKYFSAAAAVPGALFSIWHNLTGALLATWWTRRTP